MSPLSISLRAQLQRASQYLDLPNRLRPALDWLAFADDHYRLLAQRTDLLQGLLLGLVLLLPFVWVFTGNYTPNPDSYYHSHLAHSYAQGDWLYDGLPWLPYTLLGESPFPQVYMLSHLLLAPLHWFLSPEDALLTGAALTGSALLLSIFWVLRLWGVVASFWWGIGAWLMAPLLITYILTLKGAAIFLPLFIWVLDALVRRRPRRLLLFTWLSTYAYVGAPVLLPIAACFTLSALLLERRLVLWPITMTALGLAGGLLLHPYFPANLEHVLHEFSSYTLTTGGFLASEWQQLTDLDMVASGRWLAAEGQDLDLQQIRDLGGWLLALTPVAIVLSLLANSREQLAVVLVLCILAAGTLASGSKLMILFLLVAALYIPLALHRFAQGKNWVVLMVLPLVLTVMVQQVPQLLEPDGVSQARNALSQNRQLAEAVRDAAAELETVSEDGQEAPKPIVVVPWDAFPYMLYFNPDNRYIAGMNVLFMDPKSAAFLTYYHLYEGNFDDPEVALPHFYEGAKVFLVRKQWSDVVEMVEKRTPAFEKLPLSEQHTENWNLYRITGQPAEAVAREP